MNYSYYIYMLFFPLFIISSMMSLLMKSWISLWMIMEINMLSIIMLMLFDKMMNYEVLMKYFLFQSFNSYIYLINSLIMFFDNFMLICLIIMNMNMLMKMSLIPFHYWYIKIMNNMNWMNIFNMSIINKIIPLFILNNILNFYNMKIYMMNLLILIISSFISSILGINQMNLKIIFSYSSMIQMSWIIMLMIFNEYMSMVYFLIYSFIMFNILYLFNNLNLNYLIQMNSNKMKNNYFMMLIMFMMFSLSSIPPMLGFLMKWLNIQMLIFSNLYYLYIYLMIMNSMISIFFYFRIMILIMLNYYQINKMNMKFINFNIKLNMKILYISWLNFFLIILYELF